MVSEKKRASSPKGVSMIYYRISYSNECTCHGMPIRGINEYIAFRTWRAVYKYINNIKKNYSYYMFYEITPALIDGNAPQFKIYN